MKSSRRLCGHVGYNGLCGKRCFEGRCHRHRSSRSAFACKNVCGEFTFSVTGYCLKCGNSQNTEWYRNKKKEAMAAAFEKELDEWMEIFFPGDGPLASSRKD